MASSEKVLIIGAGTMGEGIAQSFAQNGYGARVVDIKDEFVTRALGQVRQNVEQFVEFGLITEPADQVMGRVEGMVTTDMAEAVDGCAYVIEAVPEVLDLKRDLLARLQAAEPRAGHRQQHRQLHHGHARRGAAAPGQPDRHPLLQPRAHHPARGGPPRHGLLGRRLRPRPCACSQASGKTTVLVRVERPGFIVNRLMGALEREIDYLLDEGIVTPEDLDVAVKSSTGFRFACLGPMELEDMIGLDIAATVSGRVFKGLSNATEPSPMLVEKVEKGELGIKSGKGWYDYSGRTREEVLKEKNARLLPQLRLFLEAQKQQS